VDARQISDVEELLRLAAQIRCLTGRDDCRCGGCQARTLVREAAEHVERGDLLDAHFALTRAASRYVWRELDDAADALWLRLLSVPRVAVA
jgi:hypothetical protein